MGNGVKEKAACEADFERRKTFENSAHGTVLPDPMTEDFKGNSIEDYVKGCKDKDDDAVHLEYLAKWIVGYEYVCAAAVGNLEHEVIITRPVWSRGHVHNSVNPPKRNETRSSTLICG